MKKSRKLAWVVLGVVLLGVVTLFVQMSWIYSPWRPYGMHVIFVGGGEWLEANTRLYDGRPNSFPFWIVRHQKYPWLLGPDTQRRKATQDEYMEIFREN